MTHGVEARLDGNTLVVRVPMRFHRRGGRKRIVAPDGSAIVPTSKPRPDSTLVKALARAWRWQRMLDEGRFASVRELAEAERVSLSYTSRVLRLTLLAPDIVERILEGVPGTILGGAHAAVSGRVGAAADPVLLRLRFELNTALVTVASGERPGEPTLRKAPAGQTQALEAMQLAPGGSLREPYWQR